MPKRKQAEGNDDARLERIERQLEAQHEAARDARDAEDRASWAEFLATDPKTRSNTSVCLKIVDPWFASLSKEAQSAAASKIASLLEKEGVAFDIGGYRAAPPGLRIWCGATVETSEIQALAPWLDWAFAQVKNG